MSKLRPDKGIQMRVIVETQRFVGWGYRASWLCYIHRYILNVPRFSILTRANCQPNKGEREDMAKAV